MILLRMKTVWGNCLFSWYSTVTMPPERIKQTKWSSWNNLLFPWWSSRRNCQQFQVPHWVFISKQSSTDNMAYTNGTHDWQIKCTKCSDEKISCHRLYFQYTGTISQHHQSKADSAEMQLYNKVHHWYVLFTKHPQFKRRHMGSVTRRPRNKTLTGQFSLLEGSQGK